MNYSYVSLLTDDSYVYGIILLTESMKQVNTQYPLHVLVTNNVSKATLEILNQLDVTYEVVDMIKMPEQIYDFNMSVNPRMTAVWENCLTKFKIFNLTQFKKIIFLDADIMVLKNLDHLFEKPHMTSALDGEYFNLWPGWDHFNSGIMVIEPSEELFNNILDFANHFLPEFDSDKPLQVYADQEILNIYYKDWPEKKELHLNKYYDVFPPYVQTEQLEDLKENCYFVHYVGRKPWVPWLKNPIETYDEYYYNIGKELVQNKVLTLDWQKIRSNLILTVYAICKNEKQNVEKWIKSFGEADYICILDTGSTDGTWELLNKLKKKYSNLIIGQKEIKPWRYDVARNESMKLIPKDTTIFFMADLDEIIKEKGWTQIVKDAWQPTFDRGEYAYHRDVADDGTIERTIQEYRIHSKDWIKYENIVHEALINRAGEKQFLRINCTPINIQVWHFPDKNKKRNYAELCEANLKLNPNDGVMRLQLAIEYEILRQYDKAAEQYVYMLTHDMNLQEYELARCYYGLGAIALQNNQIQQALNLFAEGRIACPYFFDNYLIASFIYHDLDNFEIAIDLLKLSFENCKEAFWCSINDINTFVPYYYLALNYYKIHKNIIALGLLQIAHTLNSSSEEVIALMNEIINQSFTTSLNSIL